MKKLIALCAVLISLQATAQKSTQLPKLPKKDGTFIATLNFDNYLDLPDDAIEIDAFGSRGFAMLFMGQKNFGGSGFSIAWGLGLTSHNVRSNSVITYNADKSETMFLPLPDSVEYDKNKLVTNFFDQTLELRFKTRANSKQQSFFIHAGFKIAELIQSHTKFKDDDGKTKNYKIANLTTFQYGPTARIGFGRVAVSGFYSLTPLFKDGKGPEATPISIGLSFLL